MAGGGARGRGRRWLVGAVVLLLAVPLSAGVLASRSDEPWGSRAEEWVAQYLLVNGTARFVQGIASGGLRWIQSGLAQSYVTSMLAGTAAILWYLLR